MPVHEPLAGRSANLISGIGAMLRVGGCMLDCRCHDDVRIADRSPFTVLIGTAHTTPLPRRW